MTTLDLNDAGPQRTFDLIPRNTICTVQMIIKMGGAGEGGWLTRSKDGGCDMLNLEFVIVDGEYAKRKIWQSAVLTGTTDGHQKAAEISRAFLRGVLESVRNIKPNDTSDAAQSKRKAELADFNNLRFIARIGVEKSKNKDFPDDKNRVEAVTPEQKEWKAVEQIPASAQMDLGVAGATSAKPAQAIARPEWAG